MTTITEDKLARSPTEVVRGESAGVIELWALLGLAWTALVLVVVARWISSGHATPVAIQGPDVFDGWRLIGMRVLEASSMLFVFGCVYGWIILPWRRERRFTLEGMMIIGGCVGFFIDPLINNFRYTFAWNQYAVNLGTWASFIPTWAPQSAYAEGILWAFPQYIMAGAGFGVLGYFIFKKLRQANANMSMTAALAIVFCVFFMLDFIVENTLVFLRIYAFARTHRAMTLFPGQLYQFPIYESIFVGSQAVPLTLLVRSARESKDGLSYVERGAGRLPAGIQPLIRCFAVIGFTFVIYAAGYFFPTSWLSITTDSNIALPSYLQPAAN